MSESSQKGLEELLGRDLLDQLPFNVAVIDRDFRVVLANRDFEEYFGNWRGLKCHEVCKGSPQRCAGCRAASTFQDGLVRVSDEAGVDRHGRTCHYVVHLAPLMSEGRVAYVIEMTTDLTETRGWRREYDLFFERVPCAVSVIGRDYRIVRANEKFRGTYGEAQGRLCYEAYKRRKRPCPNCPATLTFQDGGEHVSSQVGVRQDGTRAYYVVTTAPLSRGEAGIAHVIEMSTDVTELRELQTQLQQAHHFYESLIQNAGTGILAVNAQGKVRIMNPAARALLGWTARQPPSRQRLRQLLPAEFFAWPAQEGAQPAPAETCVRTAQGEEVAVRLSAESLWSRRHLLGRAVFLEDLREVKRLEQEKLDAERLGAVGQTVAGLAHTIKNLLMGLEGGMYMMDTGLRRSDAQRITKGWDSLRRNFEKTTTLVKDFLSFAKGRAPEVRPADPNALAGNIVDLYRDAARQQGVELLLEAGPEVAAAPLDPEGIETCLTNLVSNAVDAALLREEPGGQVVVRTREAAGELVFEVQDNGRGMDQELRGKVFTTFFTTKGGKGTGLGLLTTRKIVQEHGGQIEVQSARGEGSTFRIRLPRTRLDALAASRADRTGSLSEAQS